MRWPYLAGIGLLGILLWATRPAAASGAVHTVNAGDDLQAAIDAASPGDIVELEAGATFAGNYVLPNKVGDEWITIRSSQYAALSALDDRATPATAHLMPKIVTDSNSPAIGAEYGAHHYRLQGLEVTTTSSKTTNLMTLGFNGLGSMNATSLDELPHNIEFEQVYAHGNATGNIRRGLAMNGTQVTVRDSYFSDFHEVGADSQALVAWNSPGSFTIVNNYLEAAGENVMFGGANPSIAGVVPSDILFMQNHLRKPLSWRDSEWTVKNLFELKNARNVFAVSNVMENTWIGDQHGFAVLFTPRGDDATVESVFFRNNLVEHAGAGIDITSGHYSEASGSLTRQTRDIMIEDNFFSDINEDYASNGAFVLLLGYEDLPPAENVTVRGNTFLHLGEASAFLQLGDAGLAARNFTFTDNLVTAGKWGIVGTSSPTGEAALVEFVDGYNVTGNTIVGPIDASRLPAGNVFLDEIPEEAFEGAAAALGGLQLSGHADQDPLEGDESRRANRDNVLLRDVSLDSGGLVGDGKTSIVYDATVGSLSIDTADADGLTTLMLSSAAGIFQGDAALGLDGIFDRREDDLLFKADFFNPFGSFSLGTVARPGLSEEFLLADLSASASFDGGGVLQQVDLVYLAGQSVVPEPPTLLLLLLGLAILGSMLHRWRKRSAMRE